jgi:glycosyltransferase involved in cell wall biosynthesis
MPRGNSRGSRVSVIIPCHGDGAFLPGAVASVREQEEVELVVVDDHSQDPATGRVLDSLEAAGVRVIRQDRNTGVSATRMTGLRATTAPFVFPLDADDAVIAGVLARMADRLEAEPAASVCIGDYIELGEQILMRGVPAALDAYRLAFTNEYPASALYRRSALEEVGGWQRLTEELDARSDWSLWIALAESGARGVHLGVGEATYIRRMHPERLSSLARDRHDRLYRALRAAHPRLFGAMRDHRRASNLGAVRKFAYPMAQRLRIPPISPRLKSTLDSAGAVTLQRGMSEVELERFVDVMDYAERNGQRLVSETGRVRRPGAPVHPPVIVIGSGRSGTAYVTRILEGLGVFMGANQDPNNEAFFFIRLNTMLLAEAGVSWSNPEAFRLKLDDEGFRAQVRSQARSHLRSRGVTGYLGWSRARRYRSMGRFDQPWGWKDPRNTFTLPLWLDLFPDARVICVHRNGIDVAASLWAQQQGRHRLRFLASAAAKRRFHLPTIVRDLRVGRRTNRNIPRITRFTSIEEGLTLWESYVEEARRHVDRLGDQALEIRFEDLLAEPERHIRLLARFCEQPAPEAVVARLAAAANPSRSLAHRGDPQLLELARRSEERLRLHGYALDGAGPAPVAAASQADRVSADPAR